MSDGSIIISYRGTDVIVASPSGSLGSDLWNGYSVGTGSPSGDQAVLAYQFYQDVVESELGGDITAADLQSVNVSFTGHSLGGGLAGLVSMTYGQVGALFNNMAFEAASRAGYSYSLLRDDTLRDFLYLGDTPWKAANSQLQTVYTPGKFLSINRIAQETAKQKLFLPLSSGLNFMERHSMATQVLLVFSQNEIGAENVFWDQLGSSFWGPLYDDDFASSIGAGAIAETSLSSAMRSAIAYSAISAGSDSGKPFGDTAIHALFGDANKMGKAKLAEGSSKIFGALEENIIEIFVEYAFGLALNDVESESLNDVYGVLSLQQSDSEIVDASTIDFSDQTWEKAGFAPDYHQDTLVSLLYKLIYEYQIPHISPTYSAERMLDDFLQEGVDFVHLATNQSGIDSTMLVTPDNYERAIFVGDEGNDAISVFSGDHLLLGAGGDDYIIGGIGNDSVIGGSGNDTIWGWTGDDTILGYTGNDIIGGDDGNDTILAGSGNDSVYGWEHDDYLSGYHGDDVIMGEAGRDTLHGGQGSDQLAGGLGQDILRGDEGRDQFIFSSKTESMQGEADRIKDFEVGVDKIVLFGLGYTGIVTSNAKEGELRIVYSDASNRTYIRDDFSDFDIAIDDGNISMLISNEDIIF